MDCPVCHGKTHIEIDTHAEGFAENLLECGDCGALWTRKAGQSILVHGATGQAAVAKH
ncbi:MAG: hypothetical protein R6V08_09920 [Desulfuromonadales bacterium]